MLIVKGWCLLGRFFLEKAKMDFVWISWVIGFGFIPPFETG